MNEDKNKQSPPEEGLTPELRAKCTKIRNLMAKEATGSKPAYQIGVEVEAVRSKPDRYGKGAVLELARELGCTGASLYTYANVAKAWPKEEQFLAMIAKTNTKGVPLTFSHFIRIAVAPSDARTGLFNRALKECLSVRELGSLVADLAQERSPKAATERAVLQRLLWSSKTASEKAKGVEEQLTALAECKGTEVATREQLEITITTYKQVIASYGMVCLRLTALLDKSSPAPAISDKPVMKLLPQASASPASVTAAATNAPSASTPKAVGT